MAEDPKTVLAPARRGSATPADEEHDMHPWRDAEDAEDDHDGNQDQDDDEETAVQDGTEDNSDGHQEPS